MGWSVKARVLPADTLETPGPWSDKQAETQTLKVGLWVRHSERQIPDIFTVHQ